jgi:hypothetical protein
MDESDAGPVVAPAASWGKRGLTLIYQITMPTTDRDGRCHSEVILSFYTGYPQPRESEAVPNAHSMDNVAHRGGDLHRNCRVDGERGHLARGRIGFDVRVTNERQALLPARARCEDHRHRRGNGRQPRRDGVKPIHPSDEIISAGREVNLKRCPDKISSR